MRIADAHAHIFPHKIAEKASEAIGDFYDVITHHVANLDVLLNEEKKAGISTVLVSSSATYPEQAAQINTFISACANSRPNVVALGSLFPTMENWEPELERIIELGLRGIKVHPDFQKIYIDDPRAVPMYRAIAKAGLPVLFHTGDYRYEYSAPERLTNLIRKVPDLIAIAAHFGGWQAWDHACNRLYPENVFFDTSSTLMFLGRDRGQEFLERIGPERFLFGTDFPMWSPPEELDRFMELDLDDTTRERILYGNFESLFMR